MLLKFNNFSIPKEALILFILIFIIAVAFPSWANAIFASIVVASIFGIMVAVNSASSFVVSAGASNAPNAPNTHSIKSLNSLYNSSDTIANKDEINADEMNLSVIDKNFDNFPTLNNLSKDNSDFNTFDEATTKIQNSSNAYYNPNGFKWMENESYTNCYAPPSYDIENCNLYSYLPFDEANSRMASLRQRDKRAIDGWAIKNANYYKKHFGRELAEEEAKRWWGNQEY